MRLLNSSRRLLGGASRLALAAAVFAASDPALAATCDWLGGAADYSTASQWSCGVVPGSGDMVAITAAGSVVSILNENESSGAMTLGGGNTLGLNNSNLYQYGDVINNGTITVANGSQLLNQSATLAYSGAGAIVLDDSANVARIYGGTITFGAQQVVSGSGQVGFDATDIINNGVITADVAGRTLDVDAMGGSAGRSGAGVGTNGDAGLYNMGLMQADGGTLAFESGVYENSAAGVIKAVDGGTVSLNADSRIIGGTLTSVGATSAISALGTTQYLQSVTLSSGTQLNVNNDNLYVNTALTNDGVITVSNGSQLLSETGAVSYGGAGTIVLDDSANVARIYGGTVTFGSGQIVRGAGQIGYDQAVIVNNGLISADVGGGIDVDANGNSVGVGGGYTGVGADGVSGLVNTAIMQGKGASLAFESGRYDNTAGLIQAIDSGTVALNADSRIIGGTLTADATSAISALNTTQYLQSVTLSSGSRLNVNNDNLYVNTALTNDGVITVSNGSQLLSETGAVSYGGAGTIVLDDSANVARIYGGTVTFGASQTVHGAGQIGYDQAVIVNNGLISADVGGGIDVDANGNNAGVGGGYTGVGADGVSGLVNTSIMQGKGANLAFESGRYDNTAGLIQAIDSGTVSLNADSRIIGGTLTSVGATSAISALGTTQYLQSVTLSSGTQLNVNNDNLYVNTALTNDGVITVSNGSQLLSETGAVSYGGAGTIVLDDSANVARIYGGTVTFGSGQTVRGAGQIGYDQAVIVNNGLISADVGGGIDVDANGNNAGVGGGYTGVGADGVSGLVNTAIMQGKGANLAFESGRYDNTAGLIQAIDNGTVSLNADSRIIGGTLTADATSAISALNTTQYLQSVTLSSGSRLNVNNDNLYVNTALTNDGVITVSNGSNVISETAAVTYGGAGTIVLDDSANLARIYGGTVTFGASQTVSGSGQLGYNQTVLVNDDLISGDVNGRNLDLDVSGGNAGLAGAGVGTNGNAGMLNNGVIEATNSGTVTFEGGLYQNANLIEALDGGTIALGGDSRIVGGMLTSDATSTISASNTTQYLQSVTLSSGSRLNVNNDNLYVNTALTNDGVITVSNGSNVISETGAVTYGGAGTIVLDDSANAARLYGGTVTFGASQTVSGSGQLGYNQTVIVNDGLISGDVGGRNLDIDPTGGNAGVGPGLGVGTLANSGLLNSGTIEATNGGTVTLEGGLYENTATGQLLADTGSTIAVGGDASLLNLGLLGVLDLGAYTSTTTGAQSTLNLQSNLANSIVTIGTPGSGTDTVVTLSGANSVLQVVAFAGGAATTIDSSLTSVGQTGELKLLDGRDFTVTAGLGAFSNAGLVELGASTFGATSYLNSGTTFGSGAVTVGIVNTGTVEATGGTLTTEAITGPTGTIASTASGTLAIGGASTAAYLTNDGHLALGTNDVTVTTDYQNASFGGGNAFTGHANATGSGSILAVSATMDLSGPALSGNTLDVGNVRIGGSSSTTLTVTDNGVSTMLRGAVQNTDAPSVALTNVNFVLAPSGGASTTTISYTGTHAGALDGQSLDVVNNFDNVASRTIEITGNVYQPAVAGSEPTTVTLAASRVGDAVSTSAISIANVAPYTAGYTESLSSTASTSSPFEVNGAGSVTTADLASGSSQSIALGLGTGTAGKFSGTVGISNTSIPVAGSGFSNLALASQSIAVKGDVYAPAVAQLSSSTVSFGPVRQGATGVTGGVTLTNAATGALTDSLNTSVGATPGHVTTTSTPGALAEGASGGVTFALNTATAGVISGSASLGFTSTDSELSPLALASQSVSFSGTVTELAQAGLTQHSGVGTLTGSGDAYTLDLGTFSGTGSATDDLGALNEIVASAYSEELGGSFTSSDGQGFSFDGAAFSGLAGGSSTSGDTLTFDYTGLAAGKYSETITLNAFSAFPGLSNEGLGAVTLDITADVAASGGGGGVSAAPEPAVWAQLMVGVGVLGAILRRRRSWGSKPAARAL